MHLTAPIAIAVPVSVAAYTPPRVVVARMVSTATREIALVRVETVSADALQCSSTSAMTDHMPRVARPATTLVQPATLVETSLTSYENSRSGGSVFLLAREQAGSGLTVTAERQ